MNASPPRADPASRFRAIALVLALACAALAATVLVLVLRTPERGSPLPSPPGSAALSPGRAGTAPREPSPLVTAANRAEIADEPGMYRLDGQMTLSVGTTVRRAAEQGAELVTEIPEGTVVELVARQSGWTLIAWPNGTGGVLIGWVVLPPSAAARVREGGKIHGVVRLTGEAPIMKVPRKMKDAEWCRDHPTPYNAVLSRDGKLKDVFIRIENGGVKGHFPSPPVPAAFEQVNCMYSPRIQGVMVGQQIEVRNGDETLHVVHSFKGKESWFSQAQPKGTGAVTREATSAGFFKLTCDVHPWMRAFVVVTDHPFFAVTGDDGSFSIEGVPPGEYNVEAWHSHYGLKKASVTVGRGERALDFTYDGTEPAPDINRDELKDLF